jgi:hypothetical protein
MDKILRHSFPSFLILVRAFLSGSLFKLNNCAVAFRTIMIAQSSLEIRLIALKPSFLYRCHFYPSSSSRWHRVRAIIRHIAIDISLTF